MLDRLIRYLYNYLCSLGTEYVTGNPKPEFVKKQIKKQK